MGTPDDDRGSHVVLSRGYSLDNLSLMALTIATGFVVDDAIIMIENIMRRMDDGETAMQPAMAGVRQMAFTVISITAALAPALVPILFMPDIVGRYSREFGVTLVVAITASAVVSLTLTPMLCGHLLGRGRPHEPHAERAPGRLAAFYGTTLDWTLRHRLIAVLLTLAVTGATIWLYVILPKGFMPTQDTGVMFVRTSRRPAFRSPRWRTCSAPWASRSGRTRRCPGLSPISARAMAARSASARCWWR